MILKNIDYLITQNPNRDILRNVDVVVDDGKIKSIGYDLAGEPEVDCDGQAVLPGLINGHTHLELTGRKGLSDDKPLFRWLRETNETPVGDDWKYNAVALSLIELLRSGTTCVYDCYNSDRKSIRALRDAGIRASLSAYLIDGNTGDKEQIESQLAEAELLCERLEGDPRLTPALGPHSIYNCSGTYLERIADVAQQRDLPVHIHLAESEKEREMCLEAHGQSPTEYLHDRGILETKVIAAHGVHLDEDELELLSEDGAGVVHCPCSNMKLGVGVAKLDGLREAVDVGIGTDGAATNNNVNILEEAKVASLLQKLDDPRTATAQQLLDHLTIEGAAALGRANEIGSIETDKKADLICLDLAEPTLAPRMGERGLISNIIFGFNGPVQRVIVGGDVVLSNGRVLGLNRKTVVRNLQRAVDRME